MRHGEEGRADGNVAGRGLLEEFDGAERRVELPKAVVAGRKRQLQVAVVGLELVRDFRGIGGQLVEPKAVAAGDFKRLRDLAKQYVDIVKTTRG